MGKNYWITTHWPPDIGDEISYSIYLYDGSERAGVNIKCGDMIWIYESKSARHKIIDKPDGSQYTLKRQQGKGGVIALAEVVRELRDIGGVPSKYDDGSELWWRWMADGKLVNQSGFVSRMKLTEIMGYGRGYAFRGFGDKRSGLKLIDQEMHQKILEAFNQEQPSETKPIIRDPRKYIHKFGGKGGGEGPEHKQLKESIAADPEKVLGEDGLTTIQMEYPFPTGDRADIMLVDKENRYVAIEVEVKVDMSDLSGVLQAIKYSRMYAIECRRKFEEVRAFLVAHQISQDVIELCKEYDIETFVVDR